MSSSAAVPWDLLALRERLLFFHDEVWIRALPFVRDLGETTNRRCDQQDFKSLVWGSTTIKREVYEASAAMIFGLNLNDAGEKGLLLQETISIFIQV